MVKLVGQTMAELRLPASLPGALIDKLQALGVFDETAVSAWSVALGPGLAIPAEASARSGQAGAADGGPRAREGRGHQRTPGQADCLARAGRLGLARARRGHRADAERGLPAEPGGQPAHGAASPLRPLPSAHAGRCLTPGWRQKERDASDRVQAYKAQVEVLNAELALVRANEASLRLQVITATASSAIINP